MCAANCNLTFAKCSTIFLPNNYASRYAKVITAPNYLMFANSKKLFKIFIIWHRIFKQMVHFSFSRLLSKVIIVFQINSIIALIRRVNHSQVKLIVINPFITSTQSPRITVLPTTVCLPKGRLTEPLSSFCSSIIFFLICY
jgi:hypothetical protein